MFATEVITQSALDTLLWVSSIYDEHGEEIESADARFGTADFPAVDVATMQATVEGFLACISDESRAFLLDNVTAEQIGHDLVLTAQHHGAGFWDRGHPQQISDDLTKRADTFTIEFEVGADNLPHVI